MKADVQKLILDALKRYKKVTTSDIVKKTSLSQPYVNRFFKRLVHEGKIQKLGGGRAAYYVKYSNKVFRGVRKFRRTYANAGLSESEVLETIDLQTGIFRNIKGSVRSIVNYGFSEMLNNAIEHSLSGSIKVEMERIDNAILFEVTDYGIGIFKNLRKKYNLKNDFGAIEELLKGKLTTKPQNHTGEGIFFTSKAADYFVINSPKKKIIFENTIKDVFVHNSIIKKGTRINFSIALNSKRTLESVFNKFTDQDYRFTKTEIRVKLYKYSSELISRSQAKRLFSGLESFKTIILDFKNVELVGQGFADEIFRVYQNMNKHKKIKYINANENTEFMIKRALTNLKKND